MPAAPIKAILSKDKSRYVHVSALMSLIQVYDNLDNRHKLCFPRGTFHHVLPQ